ncbi:MAG: PaaI family thioesterase [Methanobacteriota archaeon]|nr:MAG: PaaI family thioesterase [Euryarchaeota archaeon]
MEDKQIAVQDKYGPEGICFGCGPKNPKGLQIKSFWEGDDFVLRFNPREEHQAFEGVVNGGIIGALFDCHSNWCAATELFRRHPDEEFPSTVTSEFHVKLKRPTPFGPTLVVKARPVEVDGNKVTVEAEMEADGKITATCRGVFVAVKEGHPAYHRWK